MTPLSSIQDPRDLRALSLDQLETLIPQMRQLILDVMGQNGGHLGSNMGIVELTLGLHYVFESPIDKFIFDVSHQTYPHKLLTGRQDRFSTIRQYEGLCGFAHPDESIHDHFFAGHAGTALSLGLGMAKGRDLKNEDFFVLPIIGDATLTCGLTLEALNNLPKNLSNFIVLLNDNDMSISQNVGAVPEILKKTSDSFFSHFGFEYQGPFDGHDLKSVISHLQKAKESKRPVLLHAITTKGKGLSAAESNPISWHGCAAFDKVAGKKGQSDPSKKKFPQVFGEQLSKMQEKDPSIVTITPAMSLGSCLPKSAVDVGIAEGHAVTFSGGIGKVPGTKVVCSIYATFLQRAFDNLFQDVCLQKTPVVFALDRAGLATGDGATHHGIYDISFLNAMPGMIICQPRNGHLLKELMQEVFSWNRPVAIRYPNMATTAPDLPLAKRLLGKGEVLKRGSDIALIALGVMCEIAFEVAHILEEKGLSVTIIDPIFVKPIDETLLHQVFTSHQHVVTIEEHALASGFGNIVNQFFIQNGPFEATVQNFGIPDTYLEHGGHRQLLASVGLDPETIAEAILQRQGKHHDYCALSS